jgi:hypothetical protein
MSCQTKNSSLSFVNGNLFRTKKDLMFYLDVRDIKGIKIPAESILLYLRKKKRRRSGDPLYFLWDNKMIRLPIYSYRTTGLADCFEQVSVEL